MASILPITLVGDNLGARHKHLNTLVNEAFKQGVPFNSVQNEVEKSPVDRLFKIDLASKYKNVDYILENLKDEDMLYVTRALKSKWLFHEQYLDKINPNFLENVLYPEMTTTAVNKMKHWVHQNLKDTKRSEEFFDYYVDKELELALRHLWNCSNEFILEKFKLVMDKLKPTHLKILSEKCPKVAKVFYASLDGNRTLVSHYLKRERMFLDSLKIILKIDPDIYLDILENYHNGAYKLSSEATRYILENHRERFNKKSELYTTKLLDMEAVANVLSEEEIKDLLLKLAKAKYLSDWFEYKSVEPLLKSLKVDERTALKKRIFVDKDVGETVKDWPYKCPRSPELPNDTKNKFFEDTEQDPEMYTSLQGAPMLRYCCYGAGAGKKLIRKRKGCPFPRKTSLDRLFDNYRFTSFEKTFNELRKKIAAADSKHRQYFMLVLVSKSGGRPEHLETLLKLLTKHQNEPENLRAAVVRSLVKRAFVWRVPQTTWELLMTFGRGLGLDGQQSSVPCKEGVHAVVLRSLLNGTSIDRPVWESFLKDFSNYKEYSLNKEEINVITAELPALLLADVNDILKFEDQSRMSEAITRLDKIFDINDAYRMRSDSHSFVTAIAAAYQKDEHAERLLRRLFDARIRRKEFIREYFKIAQHDASYLNALKHDIHILESAKEFAALEPNAINHDMFLRKLALYFSEENGLADKYLTAFRKRVEGEEKPDYRLARPLAILARTNIIPIIKSMDITPKSTQMKHFIYVLKTNAHLSRPLIDLGTSDWRWMGATAIANKILRCSDNSLEGNIEKLVSGHRTKRLAFILSLRNKKEVATLGKFAERKPKFTLKLVVKHWAQRKLDPRVWDILIPLVPKIDMNDNKKDYSIRKSLVEIKVPDDVRVKYYASLYDKFKDNFKPFACAALSVLNNNMLMLSDDHLAIIDRVLTDYVVGEFTVDKFKQGDYEWFTCHRLYLSLIARFLYISKDEEEVKEKLDKFIEPMFNVMNALKNVEDSNMDVKAELLQLSQSLLIHKVFLDPKYTLCLTVLERLTEKMQKWLPLETNFDKYVVMHLTMLYLRSVRQGMKHNREIFGNLPEKTEDAKEVVGCIFGKYIAHEILQLREKYFDSITHMYKGQLHEYIKNFFAYDEKLSFIKAVVKGILSNENAKSHLLAEYLYMEEGFEDDKVIESLKNSNDREVTFFLYAHLY